MIHDCRKMCALLVWCLGLVVVVGACGRMPESGAGQTAAGSPTESGTASVGVDAETQGEGFKVLQHQLDFGAVSDEENPTLVLKVQSTSAHAVELAAAKPTCGCITTLPNVAKTLQPGEVMDLQVRFRALGQQGKLEKAVRLGRQGSAKTLSVPVLAQINPRILIQPRSLSFGVKDRADAVPSLEFVVSPRDEALDLGTPVVKDRHDQSAKSAVKVELVDVKSVQDGALTRRQHRYKVTWILGVEPTSLEARIEFPDVPRTAGVRPAVNLNGRIAGPIMTQTGIVSISPGEAGEPFERKVFFAPRDPRGEWPVVQVTKVVCPDEAELAFSWEAIQEQRGNRTQSGVLIRGVYPAGQKGRMSQFGCRLELHSATDGAELIPIRMIGHVRPMGR